MKYIVTEWSEEWRGFSLDSHKYIEVLSKMESDLPVGARKFSLNPGHYDFYSDKCVKDLVLLDAKLDIEAASSIELIFGPNDWKHEAGLRISYERVSQFSVNVANGENSLQKLGSVLLDEILPAGDGCTHEIALTGGSIFVSCADLEAVWDPSITV